MEIILFMRNNNISLQQILNCHKIGSVEVNGVIIDSDCESLKKYPNFQIMLREVR